MRPHGRHTLRWLQPQDCIASSIFCAAAVLSARLGTGKGGVRMAPDELITSVLQVGSGWQTVCKEN